MKRKQKRKHRIVASASGWSSYINAKLVNDDAKNTVKLTMITDGHHITVRMPVEKFVQAIEGLQTNSREFAKTMRGKEWNYGWKAQRLESVSSKTPE